MAVGAWSGRYIVFPNLLRNIWVRTCPLACSAPSPLIVELGTGDKFIFDIGSRSFERLSALAIPMDYLDSGTRDASRGAGLFD